MIPVSECSLRNTNEVPWPARNGATPCAAYSETLGAEELADATEAPYKFDNEKRTFYYLAQQEGKSRNSHSLLRLPIDCAIAAITSFDLLNLGEQHITHYNCQ